MKIFIAACVAMSASLTSFAQNYKTAITARAGINTKGFTVSHAFNSPSAIEGIFTVGENNTRFLFTGLYEEHHQIAGGLNWFYGAGLHIGYIKSTTTITTNTSLKNEKSANVISKKLVGGTDGIIGLTYKIQGLPIIIGADIKPYIDFTNGSGMLCDGGIRLGLAF